jgi:lipopolysaccharide transport system permease protein
MTGLPIEVIHISTIVHDCDDLRRDNRGKTGMRFRYRARDRFSQTTYMQLSRTILTPLDPLRLLWKYRYLIGQLVEREMSAKYKRSRGGLLWIVLQPLLMLVGYTLAFGVILKSRWAGAGNSIEFALIMFAGLIIFNFFSSVIAAAPGLILQNKPYVQKMVFPLEVLPWSTTLTALLNAGVSLAIWIVFSVAIRGYVPLTLAWLPLIVIPLMLFALGCCWFMAAAGVFHPDIEHLVPMFLLMLMLLSPVFFPASAIPLRFRPVFDLNPMVYVLEQARQVMFYGKAPDFGMLAIGWAAGLLFAWLGLISFLKNRDGFADAV